MLARVFGAFLIAALAVSSAHAQGYMGLGIGQARYPNACQGAPASITCDSSDMGFRLFGGYRFHPRFALEAGANMLGTVNASTSEAVDLAALDLSVLGSWPIGNRFALQGRLGAYYGNMAANAVSVPVPAVFPPPPPPPERGWKEGDNTGVTYGLGASYDLTDQATLRFEWQRFKNLGGGGPTLDVDLFSIGALHRF
jgi:OOP family OmpA-OmpF porin